MAIRVLPKLIAPVASTAMAGFQHSSTGRRQGGGGRRLRRAGLAPPLGNQETFAYEMPTLAMAITN